MQLQYVLITAEKEKRKILLIYLSFEENGIKNWYLQRKLNRSGLWSSEESGNVSLRCIMLILSG